MSLSDARNKAYQLKLINNDSDIKHSTRKGKRFMIRQGDKYIHFGVWPFSGKGTYLDHGDDDIRKAWKARHKEIMKDGKPAYKDKSSPEYYSWRILW